MIARVETCPGGCGVASLYRGSDPENLFFDEALRSLGSRSACSRPFHAAAARSAVSTAIFQSGLAGIRAVSANVASGRA